jgi:hypothetical protein
MDDFDEYGLGSNELGLSEDFEEDEKMESYIMNFE